MSAKYLIHTTLTKRSKKNLPLSKISLIPILTAFVLLLFTYSYSALTFAESDILHKTIGISQIVEHAALDIVRNSMIETLKAEGFEQGKNLTLDYENAHGNLITATQIATKLMAQPLDVAVGISTPSAQTLLRAAQKSNKKIPIIFTAVTDPKIAKLNSDATDYPITGITDAPDLKGFLELLNQLMSRVKKIGILYNPSEVNSISTVKELKQLLSRTNLNLVEVSVNTTADVPEAMKSLIGKVDVLYFPQDNTVVAALQSIIRMANQSSPVLPIILPIYSDDPNIMKGVLAANGYDYKDIGHETGMAVAKVLKGASVSDIPIHHPRLKTVINETLAKKLGLNIPKSLQNTTLQKTSY